MSDESTEPHAPWLARTLDRINRLPEDNAREKGRNQMARRIARGIEMDQIADPLVWRGDDGTVHLYWERAGREVEFYIVRATAFRAQQSGGNADVKVWICANRFQSVARDILGWLYPAYNRTKPEEIARYLRVPGPTDATLSGEPHRSQCDDL